MAMTLFGGLVFSKSEFSVWAVAFDFFSLLPPPPAHNIWKSLLELSFSISGDVEESKHLIAHPSLPFTSGKWAFYHSESIGYPSTCTHRIDWQDTEPTVLSQVKVFKVSSIFPSTAAADEVETRYPPTFVSLATSTGRSKTTLNVYNRDASAHATVGAIFVARVEWVMEASARRS